MSRTRTYLRRECTKCLICGYVPDKKAKKKTKEKELLVFDVNPFVDVILEHYEYMPLYIPF
ncbi:unnamed protein product [marine sediment metagenome]|uniref:Uncharacterized protein n=1 Tax=marine sediment metagenome TaxID=412755 RepID=X1Q5W6_9ZZZZ